MIIAENPWWMDPGYISQGKRAWAYMWKESRLIDQTALVNRPLIQDFSSVLRICGSDYASSWTSRSRWIWRDSWPALSLSPYKYRHQDLQRSIRFSLAFPCQETPTLNITNGSDMCSRKHTSQEIPLSTLVKRALKTSLIQLIPLSEDRESGVSGV